MLLIIMSKFFKEIASDFKDIMVLSIENIGLIKFFEGSYKLINQMNLRCRIIENSLICILIFKQNIKSIKAQYIVSGSAVYMNYEEPKIIIS